MKIQRTYRIEGLVDGVIKRSAEVIGRSEADYIELCVLAQTEFVLSKVAFMERLGSAFPLSPDIAASILVAKREALERFKEDVAIPVKVATKVATAKSAYKKPAN